MRNNIYVQITLVKRVDQGGWAIGIWICNDGDKTRIALIKKG